MNLGEIKKTMGFSLVGEYLRGANNKAFPKSVDSKSIGVAVLGESYSFGESLVDIKKYTSPSISCGTLSSLIDTVKTQIDDVYARAEGVFPFDNLKRDEYVTDFARKLLANSLPIAYAEGADDDELKQDISILLRQSKEEFEKRVKENEEEKEAEKQNALQDDPTGVEGEEPTNEEGMEETGEMIDNDSVSEIPTDLGPEEGEGEEPDDGWENEDDEDSEEGEEDTSTADEFFEGKDDDEENDDDDEDDSKEGKGESFGLTKKQSRLLSKYNAQKTYAEEQKFYISGVFSSIPYGTLMGMCEKLLQKEAENFKAIGESFDFKDIRPNTRLHKAHSDYVESVASVMVMKNRFDLPIE